MWLRKWSWLELNTRKVPSIFDGLFSKHNHEVWRGVLTCFWTVLITPLLALWLYLSKKKHFSYWECFKTNSMEIDNIDAQSGMLKMSHRWGSLGVSLLNDALTFMFLVLIRIYRITYLIEDIFSFKLQHTSEYWSSKQPQLHSRQQQRDEEGEKFSRIHNCASLSMTNSELFLYIRPMLHMKFMLD